ncbi:MAG: trigger factor [Planctomycetia bacterium]|nr:trigger factor [Planctomycetia bacterium]
MSNQDETAVAEEGAETTPKKLDLQVNIAKKSSCERHITVVIDRPDIERYFDNALKDLMPKAAVPGFRQGRAPRKLVETRFRKDVTDQVKGSLLMDSLSQVSTDNDLSPISEPSFDPLAVTLPEEGAMTFEFDIEVRPEFDMPNWKGLKIERPTREFTDADVDVQLKTLLASQGTLVPHDGTADAGDFVNLRITAKNGDEVVSETTHDGVCIRKSISFHDAKLDGFDKLLVGTKAGDKKTAEVEISENAANETLRGKKLNVELEVLEVKKVELPAMTPEFLQTLGDFESEDDLRSTVRKSLERRLQYHQQQQARKQILSSLTVAADWDLPPDLLKRQSGREFERSVMELRRSGFGEPEIRAHANELLRNSREQTAKSLKEHFVLERIAEEEKIDVSSSDYDDEIGLIAEQSGESNRRVRAQMEKRGLMDTLHNQIIERKTIDVILANAKFDETKYALEVPTTEAIDTSLAGGEKASDIPEAATSGDSPYNKGEHKHSGDKHTEPTT